MRKRIYFIFCSLFFIFVIIIGRYSTTILPLSLNTYQTLLGKKDDILVSNFNIKIPSQWYIAKINKNENENEIIVSNVPKLFDKSYEPCFIFISTINIKDGKNYKKIIKQSSKINSFFCGYNYKNNIKQCLSIEKNKKVVYIHEKSCSFNMFNKFIKDIKIR